MAESPAPRASVRRAPSRSLAAGPSFWVRTRCAAAPSTPIGCAFASPSRRLPVLLYSFDVCERFRRTAFTFMNGSFIKAKAVQDPTWAFGDPNCSGTCYVIHKRQNCTSDHLLVCMEAARAHHPGGGTVPVAEARLRRRGIKTAPAHSRHRRLIRSDELKE